MKKEAKFYKRHSHDDQKRRNQNLQRDCKSRVLLQAFESVGFSIECSGFVANQRHA
jgi:hypothetical protein